MGFIHRHNYYCNHYELKPLCGRCIIIIFYPIIINCPKTLTINTLSSLSPHNHHTQHNQRVLLCLRSNDVVRLLSLLMGNCCVSSGTVDDRENENVTDKNTTIVQEETVVKEVLSETTLFTTSSNLHTSTVKDPVKTKIREDEEKKPGFLKNGSDPVMIGPGSIDPEEGSEVSEVCSLSLSESVSSTVVMNGYDEEEMMMKQRKSQRSPAKTRTQVTGNNYPTRKTDQSPRKRNNNGTCNGARFGSGTRDPGERSGRRSRSPATNRSMMDSNQCTNRVGGARTKKTNQSPGRVRLDPNKNGLDQQQHQNYGYTTEELLEHPLVSLECFILYLCNKFICVFYFSIFVLIKNCDFG